MVLSAPRERVVDTQRGHDPEVKNCCNIPRKNFVTRQCCGKCIQHAHNKMAKTQLRSPFPRLPPWGAGLWLWSTALGICPDELKTLVHTKICTQIFTENLVEVRHTVETKNSSVVVRLDEAILVSTKKYPPTMESHRRIPNLCFWREAGNLKMLWSGWGWTMPS